ncbi:MAG: Bifunctional protein GlmU [Candidatus Anoxychlamydiales bacterium]|nr:Bifunctional protein GlmU [Candidatus Anoxychlamydiales bacterium]
MNLNYKFFFDTSNFEHNSLFENIVNIFEVFDNLKKYFNKFSYKKKVLNNLVFIENPSLISIGKNTLIEPGAYIKGPCIIGDNCEIRHSAYIRGNVIVGNNCIIGHSTEIKNSIFLNNTSAAHFAYIGDSIIGNNVNIGAGVKLANSRLDKKNIKIRENSISLFDTKRNKLGSIIGDNTQIGCNSVLNPGTLIEKDAIIYGSINVSGYIPKKSIVKSQTKNLVRSYKIKGLKNDFFKTAKD